MESRAHAGEREQDTQEIQNYSHDHDNFDYLRERGRERDKCQYPIQQSADDQHDDYIEQNRHGAYLSFEDALVEGGMLVRMAHPHCSAIASAMP